MTAHCGMMVTRLAIAKASKALAASCKMLVKRSPARMLSCVDFWLRSGLGRNVFLGWHEVEADAAVGAGRLGARTARLLAERVGTPGGWVVGRRRRVVGGW